MLLQQSRAGEQTQTRGEIAVQFFDSAEDFARLAPQWNRLHDASPTASVFNSWIWQYQWWQVYGAGQPLRLLVALDGVDVVGILPLYIQHSRVIGMPVRLLRLVGAGADTHPDDLGPLIAADREEEIARKLAEAALRVGRVDVMVMSDLDPLSRFPSALEEAAAEARRAGLITPCERIAYIELPVSWAAFLQSQDSEGRRRIKSTRRKLEAHGARFFVWDDYATLDTAVDRLAALHRTRWRGAGGSESFQTPQYIDFHRRIIKAFLARGWLRLYCLELDGDLAAVTYCYRFRRRVYLMQAGFDPAKAKLNPGKALLGHAIEHAIAEGNEVFDFLRGEHRYKDELATGHRQTTCVRVFGATAGALAYRLRRIWAPLTRARLLRRPARRLQT
jgi:CelD/BcsL family acetyltransferase involved in cellulose biosynthesis